MQSNINIINHVISTKNEYITSPFGRRILNGVSEHHDGIDIVDKNRFERTSDVWAIAIADGVVVDKHNGQLIGHGIDILHEGNILTRQYHFKTASPLNVGGKVKKGDRIGILGTTGRSTGIHLHFGIKENSTRWNNGVYFDPMPYLCGEKSIGVPPAAAANLKPGDIIGNILYTDIKTYINGELVPEKDTGNIAGRTFIYAELLAKHGFNVTWDGEKRELRLSSGIIVS